MAGESFATGYNLTGDLQTAWIDNIQNGEVFGKINFPEDEVFDILRGWPIEGAINNAIEIADPADSQIQRGMFVQYDANGLLIVDDAPAATAPVKLMLAIDNYDSTTVVAANNRLPVLTTHYVVRIPADRVTGVINGTNYPAGAPVTVTAGLIDYTIGGKQIVGTVRGFDVTRGYVDVEVN